jgi:hypothetical protein
MLIRPAIGDTDPIRYRRPTPDGQFSGNILDEAMRGQPWTPIGGQMARLFTLCCSIRALVIGSP